MTTMSLDTARWMGQLIKSLIVRVKMVQLYGPEWFCHRNSRQRCHWILLTALQGLWMPWILLHQSQGTHQQWLMNFLLFSLLLSYSTHSSVSVPPSPTHFRPGARQFRMDARCATRSSALQSWSTATSRQHFNSIGFFWLSFYSILRFSLFLSSLLLLLLTPLLQICFRGQFITSNAEWIVGMFCTWKNHVVFYLDFYLEVDDIQLNLWLASKLQISITLWLD